MRAGKIGPIIDQFVDAAQGSVNDLVSIGGLATLKGSYLKYGAVDPLQGIFFVGTDGSETRVTVISLNKPGKLHFLTPALAADEYHVEVRAIIKGRKEIYSGRLDTALTVIGR